ncbi:MAG TPA: MFS transporter [Thermoplasmata archaeon]|nr:MFS transporter [Thermoplasmata archaeon]
MNAAPEVPKRRRDVAAAALFVARLVYAFNWYNVGAVLPLIGASLHASTAELGIVLGAFLVGVGAFQIPAGIAATRWNPREVSMVGLAAMSAFCIASAFAPSWPLLALARFGAGVGAAFFFAPALSLIAAYYAAGQRGLVVGMYNGGFSIGGAVGLFAGAAAGLAYGWPFALGAGGVALALSTGITWALLPLPASVPRRHDLSSTLATSRRVLLSRSIWALALGLTGFWAAIYVVAQYFVKYAADVQPQWGLGVAAILSGVTVFASFPGGPVGGWLAERGMDRRWLVGVFGLATGLLVLALPFTPLFALWPLFALLGLVDGIVFAVEYLIPAYLSDTAGEGVALGVAFINSLQVLIGSGIAIGFGFLAAADGYLPAWIVIAVLTVGLLPLLAWVEPNRARGDATPRPTEVKPGGARG